MKKGSRITHNEQKYNLYNQYDSAIKRVITLNQHIYMYIYMPAPHNHKDWHTKKKKKQATCDNLCTNRQSENTAKYKATRASTKSGEHSPVDEQLKLTKSFKSSLISSKFL